MPNSNPNRRRADPLRRYRREKERAEHTRAQMRRTLDRLRASEEAVTTRDLADAVEVLWARIEAGLRSEARGREAN